MLVVLRDEDLEDYIRIRSQLSEYSRPISMVELRLRLDKMFSNGSTVYAYLEDGKMVGTVKLNIETKIFDSVARIEDVVIDKSNRGKGFGLRMLKEVLDIARTQKCYKVVLGTTTNNELFYIKNGFSVSGLEMSISF